MEAIVRRFFVLLITLLGVMNAIAAPSPPAPTYKRPPPPPGLPINENLFVLLIIAILFGMYMIYRHQLKTKAPI